MRDGKLRWRAARHELLAIAALLLLLGLRFFPTFVCGRLYAPFNDNVFIYGPMFSETARIALHGEIPFYLPSFGVGFPLFQSPHYSPFYPFYFFGLLDYGGPLQSLYTLTYLTIFHRAILTLNFYGMLRCARISPWAAFVGAAVGTLAYNTEIYSAWITIFASYTWLPLIIGGGVLLLRNERTFLGIVMLGVSAGLLALASASQSVAHTLLFCGALFGAGAVWLWKKEGPQRVIHFGLCLLAAAIIAFGIAAVSAIPMYLGIGGMIRHIGQGFVLGHQPIPWDKFNLQQLAPQELLNVIINPRVVEIVGSPYVGPLGFVGVVLAILFFRQLDSLGRFLVTTVGAIGLYALLSALGTHSGLAYLNFHLPLINKIREAGRHLVLFVIAVSFLSGVGFDQLGRNWRQIDLGSRNSAVNSSVIVSLLVIFVAIVAWEVGKNALLASEDCVVLWLGPIVLMAGLLLRIHPWWRCLAPAVLVSMASLASPVRTFPPGIGDFYGMSDTRQLATLSALREKLKAGDYRIDFGERGVNLFNLAMNSSYFGFKTFYNKLTPQPYDQFRFGVQRRVAILREMMGSRYVLCGPNEKPLDASAVLRFRIGRFTVFENPSSMNRLTLVHSLAGTFQTEDDMVSAARRGFNFNQSVFCQKKDVESFRPFLGSSVSLPVIGDSLTRENDSVNKVAARIHSSRPGLVVLNEWFTPAWKAKVNGNSRPIVRANWWQVGVPVKAGDNVVEFRYRPSLVWVLLILNRVVWLLLALLLIGRWIYRLLKKRTPSPLSASMVG